MISGQDQSSAMAPNQTWPNLHLGLDYTHLSTLYILGGREEAVDFSVRNHLPLPLTIKKHNEFTLWAYDL